MHLSLPTPAAVPFLQWHLHLCNTRIWSKRGLCIAVWIFANCKAHNHKYTMHSQLFSTASFLVEAATDEVAHLRSSCRFTLLSSSHTPRQLPPLAQPPHSASHCILEAAGEGHCTCTGSSHTYTIVYSQVAEISAAMLKKLRCAVTVILIFHHSLNCMQVKGSRKRTCKGRCQHCCLLLLHLQLASSA